MSLVKMNKKRMPFVTDLVTSDFFDMEDFFDNRFLSNKWLNDNFWNGRKGEPALNIKEMDDKFEIELAAPGFDKKDFKVTIEEGYLKIKAEKSMTDEEKEENFTRKEFSYKAFERMLLLPENVKEEEIKAIYEQGILRFYLMKGEEIEKAKPTIVEIN
jgi:HSP20 family protein